MKIEILSIVGSAAKVKYTFDDNTTYTETRGLQFGLPSVDNDNQLVPTMVDATDSTESIKAYLTTCGLAYQQDKERLAKEKTCLDSLVGLKFTVDQTPVIGA